MRQWGRHIPPPYTPPYITATPETKFIWLTDPKMSQGSMGNEMVLNIRSPVKKPRLPPNHTFVILACDGVWDVLSNEEAVKFIAEDDGDAETVAERLVQHVLKMEADANQMEVSELMAVPPGRRRRGLHDDLTGTTTPLALHVHVAQPSSPPNLVPCVCSDCHFLGGW